MPGVAADNGLNISQCEMTPHNTPLSCHTTNYGIYWALLTVEKLECKVPIKSQPASHMWTKVKQQTKNVLFTLAVTVLLKQDLLMGLLFKAWPK